MDAKTPFDRAVACLLAASMGSLPLIGFINGFSKRLEPGFVPLIKHLVLQELLFVFSAFFLCAFLYYLLGEKSWLGPRLKKYSLRVAIVLFIANVWLLGWMVSAWVL